VKLQRKKELEKVWLTVSAHKVVQVNKMGKWGQS